MSGAAPRVNGQGRRPRGRVPPCLEGQYRYWRPQGVVGAVKWPDGVAKDERCCSFNPKRAGLQPRPKGWWPRGKGGVGPLMNGVAPGHDPLVVVAADADELPVAGAGDWRESPRRTPTFSSRRAALVATPLLVRVHLLRVGWRQPRDGFGSRPGSRHRLTSSHARRTAPTVGQGHGKWRLGVGARRSSARA